VAYRMILKMNWQVSGASPLSDTGAARSSSASLRARIAACRRGTVVCQQGERAFFVTPHSHSRGRGSSRGCVPTHAGDRLAGGERMREVDLDRVHTGNVVHHGGDLRPSPGTRVCHSASESVAQTSQRRAPASRRAARLRIVHSSRTFQSVAPGDCLEFDPDCVLDGTTGALGIQMQGTSSKPC